MTRALTPTWTIVILAALGGIGPFAIDTYLPGLPGIRSDLDASQAAVQMTMSVYLLGVALVPIFTAPLSDTFGRKPVLVTGLVVFALVGLACAVAPNVEVLIALRFFQASAGGTVMTLVRAILSDLYRGDALSRATSQMLLVFSIAPVVAPLVGGTLLEFGSWRWIFIFLSAIGVLGYFAQARLEETLGVEQRPKLNFGRVVGGYGYAMSSGLGRSYLGQAFLSGLFFFAMLSAVPFIFIDQLGFSEGQFAWVFAGISFAAFPANYVNTRTVMRVGYQRMLQWAGIGLLISGLVLGGVALSGLGGALAVFVPLLGVMAFFHLSIANTQAGIIDVMGARAGAASAAVAFFRFVGGAIGAAFTGIGGGVSPFGLAMIFIGCAVGMTALAYGVRPQSIAGTTKSGGR